MRITRRDLGVAAGAALVAWSATSLAQRSPAPIIGPSAWEWNDLEARRTAVGEVRDVVRGPTATLEELEHLQRVELVARAAQRRDDSGDLSRHQLADRGHAAPNGVIQ
jgi:hypothetical protein